MSLKGPHLQVSSDSPGDCDLQFSPALEKEYVRNRLVHNRVLIRMACALALLVPLFRIIENLLGAAWPGAPSPHFLPLIAGATITGSVVLVWAAWSANFERVYLPVARI